ncbi:nuclear pore complex protein NUP214 [Phalaenopsis equestris]|uniref:nuclear pore complex protein NUP214 n=1 Tax=Phalaenopsis equestris TaxID=78828 RepID=UPI0009E3A61D|nr:nuclear pore complex protein NUP214 [Phalaenopsis equestris]
MPTMAAKSSRLLSLAEEIEGDRQGTVDFVFCRIGEPVPLKPTLSDSAFDLSNPPLQPLAVSERHHLIFLAHTEGFLVANTKDVIGLAKSANGKDVCVQKSSIVDVQIGSVSILALSWDNSMLAAAVGGEIHLFYVQSLLAKVQEPAISCSLSDSGVVRDLKWRRSSENSFVALSNNGLLCHGSSDFRLKDVMDNVDAVDWSVDGNFFAISRKDIVSILSSNFEETVGISLSLQTWAVDSGSEIKVDSIKWLRHDSIVVGCTQSKEDGDEDGYLVQVISSGQHKFNEVSCEPVVFSFPDLFEGLSVDMLPAGVGPYLLAEYLDCWDVAITSNRKNTDQHISLLRWLVEDNRYEVVSLELGSDKYIPRIDLQDDGDDNLIVGLAVDKSSLYEKIKIQRDLEFKELPPRCILLCLTCDGKLTLNHAAWVSEPSDLPMTVSHHGDNIVNKGFCTVSSAESELDVTTSRLNDGQDAAITDKMHPIPGGKMGGDSLMVKGAGAGKILGSANTAGSTFGSKTAQKNFVLDGSNSSVSSAVEGTEASRSLGSTIKDGTSFSSQIVMPMPFAVDAAAAKPSLSTPGKSNSAGMINKVPFSPPSNSPANFPPFSKPFGTPKSLENVNQSGMQNPSTKSVYPGSASILHSSSLAASAKLPGSAQQLLANSTSFKPYQRLESEPQISKQFYNVKDMAKELDALLSSIECEGGFKDLCTVLQEKSLLELEAGLEDLLERLFANRDKMEYQRMEIQQLCNKMLKVSARQVYMEGIVQQASDHRYWAFWNSQKLSPAFEAKRSHISNLKQNLAHQLIDLERHFNNLEINRFGEYNTTTTGWRAPCISTPSRRADSLHSLYSTADSQLLAAEKLSKLLSKQMAVLNISSSTPEKRNITKELFESIGLDPKTDAFVSPDLKSYKHSPYSSKRTLPSSATTVKELSLNHAPMKANEFESTRRKRDLLDKSWSQFEPSRTTVKRTSNKEQVRSNLDIAFRQAKGVFDSQVKAFDVAQKSGMNNVLRASSAASDSQKQVIGVTKRSSNGTAPFLSNTKFSNSNSQSIEESPIKGVQEKSSNKATDSQSKLIFKWAKDPSDLPSKPNTSLSSTSSLVSQSAGTQPFSLAASSIFSKSSSNQDEKFGSPFMLNISASSTSNNSSNVAVKTGSVSKPTSVSSHLKFSGTSSPLKLASAAETGGQLNQETSPKNKADIRASSAQTSTKNSTVRPSTSTASITQFTASATSSGLPSFQFVNSSPSNIFSSPIKSNELSFKSMPSLARLNPSEDSKIGSEFEQATTKSTNKAAGDDPPKELSSLTSKISSVATKETSQASVGGFFPLEKEVGLHSSIDNNLGMGNTNNSKLQHITSQIPPLIKEFSLPSVTNVSTSPAASGFISVVESAMAVTSEKDESLDANLSQEDEMEEEALETNTMPNLQSLGGFSLQSAPTSNAQKPNPFGSSFLPASAGSATPQLSWSSSPGQLFRPPSFNLPESQSQQLPQSTGSSSLIGGLSSGFSGFGQPAQLGAGQQALGSVLGSFGQSRQLGTGLPGFGFASAAGSGVGISNAGGFAGAATGGGFAGGGFAGAATGNGGFAGGGFAGAATGGGFAGGGFAGVASNIGGFAGAGAGGGFAGAGPFSGGFAAAGTGSGFGGASSSGAFATGGFGGFSGFSAFGSGNSSAGRPPPAELLTQMRK